MVGFGLGLGPPALIPGRRSDKLNLNPSLNPNPSRARKPEPELEPGPEPEPGLNPAPDPDPNRCSDNVSVVLALLGGAGEL